jgi:hypothetical protein
MLLSVVQQYGSYVRSAFDLYRYELAEQLGLEIPRSAEAERDMWTTISRMQIYRSTARSNELTRFRRHRDVSR